REAGGVGGWGEVGGRWLGGWGGGERDASLLPMRRRTTPRGRAVTRRFRNRPPGGRHCERTVAQGAAYTPDCDGSWKNVRLLPSASLTTRRQLAAPLRCSVNASPSAVSRL